MEEHKASFDHEPSMAEDFYVAAIKKRMHNSRGALEEAIEFYRQDLESSIKSDNEEMQSETRKMFDKAVECCRKDVQE